MKTIRIHLARWLARRGQTKARNLRRDLRAYIKTADHTAQRECVRARGRRLYAAWLDSANPGWQPTPCGELRFERGIADLNTTAIRDVITPIRFVRRAA